MRKLILMTALTLLFVATVAGQRGGMRGGGGGGMRGGGGGAIGSGPRGFGGGSNWMGGYGGGGYRGGGWGGSKPGWNHGASYNRAGFKDRGFYNVGYYQPGFYGYGAGFGYGYGPWGSWGLGMGYGGFYGATYDDSPNVVVVYPQQQAEPAVTTVYTEPVKPVMREYDFEPQTQIESPIYLFAFKDQSIRAASSYRIEAGVLYYTTLDRQEQKAALETLDRDLSLRLNRQRKVTLELPQ